LQIAKIGKKIISKKIIWPLRCNGANKKGQDRDPALFLNPISYEKPMQK